MLLTPGDLRTRNSGTASFSKYVALLDILVRIGDGVIVLLAAGLCFWLQFGSSIFDSIYPALVLRGLLLVLLVLPLCGVYRSWRGQGLANELGRMALAWTSAMLLLLVTEWALKNSAAYSRLWLANWYGMALALLGLHRFVGRRLLGFIRAHGMDHRKVVLVGATHAGRKIIDAARSNASMGLDVVGYVRTPYDQHVFKDVTLLGHLDDFVDQMHENVPDQIWVALPMRAEAEIKGLLDATEDLPTSIRLVPDLFGYELLSHRTGELAGVPVINLRGSHLEGHAHIVKALEDRGLALLILLLIAPLMLLLAIGVKLSSPGPVFYRQKRHGLGGKEIEVWKLRSMRVHAENDGKVTQAIANDPRVTRFGRFLRSSSLDELPQFINVLQGHMSIVGPRPHALAHNRYYNERLNGYMQRHGVKPGLTGLAQVRGFRGETDTLEKMAQRVECDISYIHHWSLWLDLKIIFLTPLVLTRRSNAY